MRPASGSDDGGAHGGEVGDEGVVIELVSAAVIDAAGPLGHGAGEQDDQRVDPFLADGCGGGGTRLDLVDHGSEVARRGGIGLDAPRGEPPAELGDDAQVGAASGIVQQLGVGGDQAVHQVAQGRIGTGLGPEAAPLGIDRAAPPRQDLAKEALARAEVVGDR